MGIEFVISQDEDSFPARQVLPEVYNQNAYNGKKELYIISGEGYRYKVTLKTPRYGLWYITGPRWIAFCNRNLNENVEALHFVEEGDDCFYVTGYERNGKEVGGYGGNRATFGRFMTKVLPDPRLPQTIPAELLPRLPELCEIEIKANGMAYKVYVRRLQTLLKPVTQVYQLLGNIWSNMVAGIGLEAGTRCVLTKNRGNRFWFDAFNDDGSMITDLVFKGATTLRKQQLELSHSEQKDDRMRHICYWPFHMDHFGEKNRSFYKPYSHIQDRNRLAIPAKFLATNPMHMYHRAMIIHQEYKKVMIVRMEPHDEDPDRTNHVNVYGQWRLLAQTCRFPYSKMIRFTYMSNGENVDAPDGENRFYPIFHIC